ncbi:ABC transporter ATP-binding protein [Brucella oryzae]|uniref:Histidine/lysine/arginine/ornithine ABC transporter ATP-binding protein n=1 Tax=Brucella oryzae TaxID=335286 RepID=A0A2S7IW10_9HYPH|nr:ATP-binding cassette domain-containing protein [Brucella oryzae]PQA72130.1 histidine/lysine/arginine/ornithine ABC transporter ATP-binding protein [Brucella oryzae]
MTPMALTVKNIHKSFAGIEVLKGISFEAKKGDVISLIGSSGSGKSTLLRCINYLETPDEGEIAVAGEVIRTKAGRGGKSHAADPRQLEHVRARLGMVFQSFNLWSHRTILENIIEGPIHVLGMSKAEALAEAEVLMEKVGITPKRDQYPTQLSGGQQQRAAIARALAMKPEVMLFDEPTSALDPELVTEVLQVIKKLAEEGRTMVMVTHEMALAREISSEVIFLHKGLVEERGSPDIVMQNPQSQRLRQFLHMN